MDWMKENDYSSSPDWPAIDALVESTRMKPSEVAAWAAELGGVVGKLRNSFEQRHERVFAAEDDDSVPVLAEDEVEDDLNGLVADDATGPLTAKPHSVSRECPVEDIDNDADSLEDLVSELGFEYELGDLESCDNLRLHSPGDQMLNVVALGSSADDDLFGDFCLQLDPGTDGEEDLQLQQRPFKRQRSDPVDLLALGK